MSAEVERLALACVLPGFAGPEAPDWVRRRLAEGLGGVVLFGWNVESSEQLRSLTAALRAEGEVLVGIDEEGGDVTRLEVATGSSYPGNAALGAVDDVELTERVAASIGADLADVGVNLNLAPVADVNTNPLNPVIGIRSFGADGELVARHVAASVRGLQSAGVAACAKHFPGHGDTSEDSHHELPVVESLEEAALAPFRAAIAAGVQAIMTAHIVVRPLGETPATMSRELLARPSSRGAPLRRPRDHGRARDARDLGDRRRRGGRGAGDRRRRGRPLPRSRPLRRVGRPRAGRARRRRAHPAGLPESRLVEAAERVRASSGLGIARRTRRSGRERRRPRGGGAGAADRRRDDADDAAARRRARAGAEHGRGPAARRHPGTGSATSFPRRRSSGRRMPRSRVRTGASS